MNINDFVLKNNLQPADAVVLHKKFMGMVDHFVIYIGDEQNEPKFVANFNKGIKILPNTEINEQLKKYIPKKIERYPGDYFGREEAVNRALSRLGEKAYGLFSNNCEHFKNWVHFGTQYSKQVDVAGTTLTAMGGVITAGGVLSSNKKSRNWGTAIFLLGIGLKFLAERSNNSDKS
ncbi:lecithin retinol acyltransferase family protein [Tenacibaculum maritimum]|uniref:lecithin retinol acyltransferase family protein n=1 Tax=Tenacibaculum maritimum TaxID=107401 RepID=UPI0012E6813B|nr:lecithin retinol acyltransferase family protein [Tenacibaculum maritimum]MCD9563704.1 lecithin retinol acyltransferase family protein [Tenacibaculum maritimum]MCD9565893.1 lecithin retinol acyltransferase family protein [Tenacibaculum maritimum]MCD9579441.1 lecithin retinol acyltransferase family protein [Tenacibaculum maritimum]MCD9596200.1 lecithin retinol acyltransferase family protein [Tenacibaculum maritimum]MCD9613449.1 lecithin retinol acyltransferase family protein [Tenacibaculum ma